MSLIHPELNANTCKIFHKCTHKAFIQVHLTRNFSVQQIEEVRKLMGFEYSRVEGFHDDKQTVCFQQRFAKDYKYIFNPDKNAQNTLKELSNDNSVAYRYSDTNSDNTIAFHFRLKNNNGFLNMDTINLFLKNTKEVWGCRSSVIYN